MNERLKILKLLEQGKITAEEAAKLLQALGNGKKKEVSSRFVESIMDGVSSIVGVIPETIGGVFSFANEGEKEIEIEKSDEFFLKSVGSSIKLSPHSSDKCNIRSGSGIMKTKKEDSKILVKVVGGSADVLYPFGLPLSIKDVGGSIDGIGTAKFSLKQMGGSTQLSFDKIEDVQIDSKGGALKILLGDCDVNFDISAPGGNINFELPADFEIKKEGKVKGKIKKGTGKLVVMAQACDVSVLPIKRKEKK